MILRRLQKPANSPRAGLAHSPGLPPRGITLLLAALAALAPFSIDTYLPSLHDIGATLHATPLEVQQTLTAYMLSFAVMTLWHGAISDAVGRRRAILVGLMVFAIASVGCMLATRIEHLWLCRALQGVTAGSGMVIGRAIARDLFDGVHAQHVMARITMMFALAPAIAPVIGGWLQSWFGWRSVFGFLVIASVTLLLVAWRRLPETLPSERRNPLNLGYLARAYGKTLSSPPFFLASGAIAFNFGGYFIYVVSAPAFLMRHLGVAETGFLWLFGPAMAGLMAGSWIAGRVAGSLSRPRTLAWAYGVMGVAVALNISLNLLLPPSLPWSVLPIAAYALGMAVALPCLTLCAIDCFPAQRGLASSCQAFIQFSINAVAAGLLAPVLWDSTLGLAFGMGMLALLGGSATWLILRHSHALTTHA